METDREEDRGPELHLPRFIFDGPRSSSYVDFRVNLVDVKLEIDAIRAMEGGKRRRRRKKKICDESKVFEIVSSWSNDSLRRTLPLPYSFSQLL